MPRVVKPAPIRQDEILDIAERLFLARGYEHTPVQAIIDEAKIAKGTFYHHYPSKSDLLDAVIARYTERAMAVARVHAEDAGLNALEKLNRVFSRTTAWKTEQRHLLIELHRALHADANAALYARMQREGLDVVLPLVAAILEQGLGEGLVRVRSPRASARLLMELAAAVSRHIGDALLDPEGPRLSLAELDEEIDAAQSAIDALLGTPPGALQLFDRAALAAWLEMSPPRRTP